jgi:predicted nucleotidyltransferase
MKVPPLSHLTPNERTAIAKYVAQIRDCFPGRVLSATLFGSKARGDADAESDIDLLVLVDAEDNAFRSELWRIASDVSLEHNVVLSVRVYAQDHWAETQRIRLPLYRAIAADGISLVPEHPFTQPAGQREFEG